MRNYFQCGSRGFVLGFFGTTASRSLEMDSQSALVPYVGTILLSVFELAESASFDKISMYALGYAVGSLAGHFIYDEIDSEDEKLEKLSP